jgi:hypothetical protein
MLDARKAFAPLTPNTKYQAILRSYVEYEPTEQSLKTRPDSQGFIVFKFTLVEDGREISDSRSFPVGTDILARQLLAQTELPNATGQIDLFRNCIETEKPLDVWVIENNGYHNYTFQEPQAQTTAPQEVDNKDFN